MEFSGDMQEAFCDYVQSRLKDGQVLTKRRVKRLAADFRATFGEALIPESLVSELTRLSHNHPTIPFRFSVLVSQKELEGLEPAVRKAFDVKKVEVEDAKE